MSHVMSHVLKRPLKTGPRDFEGAERWRAYGQESQPNRKSLLWWELGHSPNAGFALD